MKNIHLYELKKYLKKKLNTIYIFLGEDCCLLQKNQDLILQFAYKKGFFNIIKIDIEKDKDWEQVIIFYKTKNLFFQKTILVINCLIKKINIIFIKKINKILSLSLLNLDILTILKLNHLSYYIKKKKFFNQFENKNNIISCFTPNDLNFILWIKYEIQEKNIQIEKQALFLLYKYYSGNTLFIYNILDIISITWPNSKITEKKIKKIIVDFVDYSSLHWIDYIFQFKTKQAIAVLYYFLKKKRNPLILIRALQKDLIKLMYIKRYIKREDNRINIYSILEKYNICSTRHNMFINAIKKISDDNVFKVIQILLKIEINIKKNYNYNIWYKLQELTLILNN
ncbi:DNA polymerase III subunit delta [Buchnera aphidicola (Macrosiphoniella sanborni)]|uniref:DNA polymerase III subunit delta n=1 Tax=Buchnera aphidicola (Macrosiphoniella sanborni) TaxID=1241865 RepID=A0A4D6YDY3_9GAMM|nr:DNA polymerase III subunit delta [Buchnera aphidicola (Macrosiphoniella sanborni)]